MFVSPVPLLPRDGTPLLRQSSAVCGRLVAWLDEVALPYWLARGIDHSGGGFHECLSLDGAPLRADKRLRTMARQTYAFATAVHYGWGDEARTRQALDHGLAFLNRQARLPGGGFAKILTFDGRIKSTDRDAYDYAFLVFAAAAGVRVGHPEARTLGTEAFRQLDADFYLGRGRGYREIADSPDGTDADGVRRANPHMHLLEAFTAWHRMTGDDRAHARATEIVALFHDRLMADTGWGLREFVDADLTPLAPDDPRTASREPGHAYEWAWLLHDFDSTSSDLTRRTVERLCRDARTRGTNPTTGLVHQVITPQGRPLDDSSRSWSQTEALRATLALKQLGLPVPDGEIEGRTEALFRYHISPAPRGLWFDRVGPDGAPLSESVPASIPYHLISAFTALLDDATC